MLTFLFQDIYKVYGFSQSKIHRAFNRLKSWFWNYSNIMFSLVVSILKWYYFLEFYSKMVSCILQYIPKYLSSIIPYKNFVCDVLLSYLLLSLKQGWQHSIRIKKNQKVKFLQQKYLLTLFKINIRNKHCVVPVR